MHTCWPLRFTGYCSHIWLDTTFYLKISKLRGELSPLGFPDLRLLHHSRLLNYGNQILFTLMEFLFKWDNIMDVKKKLKPKDYENLILKKILELKFDHCTWMFFSLPCMHTAFIHHLRSSSWILFFKHHFKSSIYKHSKLLYGVRNKSTSLQTRGYHPDPLIRFSFAVSNHHCQAFFNFHHCISHGWPFDGIVRYTSHC